MACRFVNFGERYTREIALIPEHGSKCRPARIEQRLGIPGRPDLPCVDEALPFCGDPIMAAHSVLAIR
jgi:hypothetical protein